MYTVRLVDRLADKGAHSDNIRKLWTLGGREMGVSV